MKNRMLQLALFFSLFVFSTVYSQYTDVINSNKPGFSESPYSVGTGVYQFESDFFYKNTSTNPTFSKPQTFGVDLFFRTSIFLEKLEVNTQLTYQKETINRNLNSNNYTAGLSKFTIGAKYLFFEPVYKDVSKEIRSWKKRNAFDKKRLIPSVAVFLGMNTDFVNNIHKTNSISPKVGVLLQHNLTNNLNIISNIFYDKIGTNFSEVYYVISATQNFSNRWSGFMEHQKIFQNHQENLNYGLGFAYLFSNHLQMNISGRIIQSENVDGFYSGIGMSYRIDKHQDSFISLDENGQQIKKNPKRGYNKSQKNRFFSRIFSFFKKKRKKRATRKRN
jgi:hypothetical protein